MGSRKYADLDEIKSINFNSMNMDYEKFIVTGLQSTMSGTYACYKKSGCTIMTGNYADYKVGDVVEVYSDGGTYPVRIVVNGVEKWNEEDRKRYIVQRMARYNSMMDRFGNNDEKP